VDTLKAVLGLQNLNGIGIDVEKEGCPGAMEEEGTDDWMYGGREGGKH
jgi:hypothetical protein